MGVVKEWKAIGIQPDMIPMRDTSQVSKGDRLFYEFGFKKDTTIWDYGSNWIRTGRFIEVRDIGQMLEKDPDINNLDYLEHHNFMLIKKK